MTDPNAKHTAEAEDAGRDTATPAEFPPPAVEDAERRIAELVASVRARDEFISLAAHELRNPMTPILFEVERLLVAARRLPEPPAAIVAGLERLERLIDAYVKRATTLLDVSRITSGKLQLELSEVDLSGLIRRVTAELTPLAEQIGSPLRLSIQEGIVGICDRLAVEQIADNLMSNAIKYGEGEPIDVALSADADTASLQVRDRGIGITAEDQARIFGRFEQVVVGRHQGGFGVGLWIVGRLVEAMGAEISVASRIGEGSSFTIRLPLMIKKAER
jgi:two-component system OmpR family sensor kinase